MCVLTCFSSGGSLLHSFPSILVISGKGTSGLSALSCSRRSFMKRTYPVNGALGALLSFSGFFLLLPLVQLLLRGFCQKHHFTWLINAARPVQRQPGISDHMICSPPLRYADCCCLCCPPVTRSAPPWPLTFSVTYSSDVKREGDWTQHLKIILSYRNKTQIIM